MKMTEKLEDGNDMKNKNKSKITLKDMMIAQLGLKFKKRVTEENYPCAPAFNFKGKQYNDCTNDPNPDGTSNSGKSWCMLQQNPHSDKNKKWGFCKPINDYDKIRENVQNEFDKLSAEARRISSALEKEIPEVNKVIRDFENTEKEQKECMAMLNDLQMESQQANEDMKSMEAKKLEWNALEQKALEVNEKLNEEEEKKKQLLENEKEKNDMIDQLLKGSEELADVNKNVPTKTTPYSNDQIKMESEITKCAINPFFQTKKESRCKECDAKHGYKDEPEGTGIYRKTFNNDAFAGSYETQLDHTIDVDFTGQNPSANSQPEFFSIIWDGWIQAPVDADYTFIVETSGGAQLDFNNEKIISFRMFSKASESATRTNKLLNALANEINTSSSSGHTKKSKVIKLVGGDKYHVVIYFYNSGVEKGAFDDYASIFFKLSWESNLFDKQIIPQKYLFTSNVTPPIKIYGDNQEIITRPLLVNDLAFKDNATQFLHDIPQDMVGLDSIKLPMMLKENKVDFYVNFPSTVILCQIDYYERAIPEDFDDMDQFITVVSLSEKDAFPKGEEAPNMFFAQASTLFRCYKKEFLAGKVEVPLVRKGLAQKGLPLILMFNNSSSELNPSSCGGAELWISQPGSPYYKGCDSSSYFNEDYACINALNGQMQPTANSFWMSKGEGAGAHMTINFSGLFLISRFEIVDKSELQSQNQMIELEFSNGRKQTYTHLQKPERDIYEFKPKEKSYSLKFTIKSIYGGTNNGFAVKVYGMKCISPGGNEDNQIKPLFNNTTDEKIISLSCDESIVNSKKFKEVNKSFGKCVNIHCMDSCYSSNQFKVYGTDNYSKDSSICKSASHSGVMKQQGGAAQLCFGKPAHRLEGKSRNGITSESKGRTDLTINFKPSKGDSNGLQARKGLKFDLHVRNPRAAWKPAIVVSVNHSSATGYKTVQYEFEDGSMSSPNSIILSGNPDVAACGTKVRNRDCKGNGSNRHKKMFIRFGPEGYNSEGSYLLNSGEVFGTNQKPYGWNISMKNNIRSVNVAGTSSWSNFNNIKESYVEFSPHKNSRYARNSRVSIKNESFTIKTGDGKFSVKVYVQIMQANSNIDLQVNDTPLATNKFIRKGELAVLEASVYAVSGNLVFTNKCESNCEESLTRMNMIEVNRETMDQNDSNNKKFDFQPNQNNQLNDTVCGILRQGPACISGDHANVLHCIFESPADPGAKSCTGTLTMIPYPTSATSTCPQASGKMLCIKKNYTDHSECVKACPSSNCSKDGSCMATGF